MPKKIFFEVDHEPVKRCETHAMALGFSRGVNGQPVPTPLPTHTCDPRGFVDLCQSLVPFTH